SGTAGQRVSLLATNGTYGNNAGVTIFNPDNNVLRLYAWMRHGGFIDVQTLNTTGTYTIRVDNWQDTKGSITFTLYDVAADVTGTFVFGDAPATVTNTLSLHDALPIFSGTAGQRVSLLATNGTYGNNAGVTIFN